MAPAATGVTHPSEAAATMAFAKLCLLLGLLGTLPMVLLTPPLQVPDEAQHFSRAYQLSELHLFSETNEARVGAMLPTSLGRFFVRFLGDDRPHGDRKVHAEPLAGTMAQLATPLDPDQRVFIEFPGSAFYSPLPYLPQAFAIALGRWFQAGPLALLFCARTANALFSCVLLALAVHVAPRSKAGLMVAGLLPMAVYEYASLSPDALVITCAFLYVAIAMRCQHCGRWTSLAILGAIGAGCVVCSIKPVYFPILLTALVPDIFRPERFRATLIVYGIISTSVVLVTVSWLGAASSTFTLARPGTDVREQATWILAHPIGYIDVLSTTLIEKTGLYFRSMIGVFGWMKVALPPLFYAAPCLALAVAMIDGNRGGERQPPASANTWNAALVLCSVFLILTVLYLVWTPIGAGVIEGVQGRYFLPLAGLAVFNLADLTAPLVEKPILPPRRVAMLCAVFVVTSISLSEFVIVSAFSVV